MTTAQQSVLEKLRNERMWTLEFACLQRDLRTAIDATRSKRGDLGVSEFARQLGVQWTQAARYLEARSAVSGGAILQKLTVYVGRPDLAEKISALATKLPDRVRSIGLFPDVTIHTVYDLRDAYARHTETLTQEDFTGLFAPHETVVLGMFHCAAEALHELDDAAVAEAIRGVLQHADFDARIADLKATVHARIKQKSDAFRVLLGTLQKKLGTRGAVASALGVSASIIPMALSGNIYESTLDKLLANAQPLMDGKHVLVPDGHGIEVDTHKHSRTNAEVPPLIDQCGETSPLGIRFVLSPQSFREIEGRVSKDDIAFAARAIETARALLNLFAQVKDPKIRQEIRRALSGEVEELNLALRLFTDAHPNKLTSLYAAQRETWARDSRGGKA